jgi:hypothetical protein
VSPCSRVNILPLNFDNSRIHLGCLPSSNPPVASIFMTNNTPPKARLAGFGITTMALDPQDPIPSSLTLEGGTMTFMAPELPAPSNFDRGGYLSLWVGHTSDKRVVPPPYTCLSYHSVRSSQECNHFVISNPWTSHGASPLAFTRRNQPPGPW